MAEALAGMNRVLNVIGFEGTNDRNNIMDGGRLAQFEDFRYLVERDIRDMADEFGKRTQANGRIVFGLGRTKKWRHALGSRLLQSKRCPQPQTL